MRVRPPQRGAPCGRISPARQYRTPQARDRSRRRSIGDAAGNASSSRSDGLALLAQNGDVADGPGHEALRIPIELAETQVLSLDVRKVERELCAQGIADHGAERQPRRVFLGRQVPDGAVA